jgi:hypothetical protein
MLRLSFCRTTGTVDTASMTCCVLADLLLASGRAQLPRVNVTLAGRTRSSWRTCSTRPASVPGCWFQVCLTFLSSFAERRSFGTDAMSRRYNGQRTDGRRIFRGRGQRSSTPPPVASQRCQSDSSGLRKGNDATRRLVVCPIRADELDVGCNRTTGVIGLTFDSAGCQDVHLWK